MQSEKAPSSKTAIIVIAFNNPEFIFWQIKLLKKFCTSDYDFIIFDNSNKVHCDLMKHPIYRDEYVAMSQNVIYHLFMGYYMNPSNSHSFACNGAYNHYKDSYARIMFIDHDLFAVKPFSIEEILQQNIVTGVSQPKTRTYYWAGCVVIDCRRVHPDLVDFSTNSELGLDTGGNLYQLIEAYTPMCGYMDEVHFQNPYFSKSQYNFYAMIWNGTFMHFTNGSNWNKSDNNEDRLKTLFDILKEKTGILCNQ